VFELKKFLAMAAKQIKISQSSSARSWIYEVTTKSTKINWLIFNGVNFNLRSFEYSNGLILVFQTTETVEGISTKGDLSWELITKENGKVLTYGSASVYLSDYKSAETLAAQVAEEFGLK